MSKSTGTTLLWVAAGAALLYVLSQRSASASTTSTSSTSTNNATCEAQCLFNSLGIQCKLCCFGI